MMESYDDRKSNIEEVREIIEAKRANFEDWDLVLIAGDFNIDARVEILADKTLDVTDVISTPANLALFNSELADSIDILKGTQNDYVKDLIFESLGEHPVTFNEGYPDQNGDYQPYQTGYKTVSAVTSKALDFIFALQTV